MTRRFVILTGVLLTLAQLSLAQFSSTPSTNQKRDTGPRALALLELSPNGTGHLVPVAIMYNGDFFDASAYKADPVPMALDSGTVYEAMHTGTSEGLFTITTAAQTGIYWTGQGKWQTSAEVAAIAAAKKKRAQAEEKPPTLSDPDSGPPKLLRRSPESKSESKPSSPAAEPAKPSASSPASVPPPNPAPAASKSAPASPAASESKPSQTPPAPPVPGTSTSTKAEAPPASAPAATPVTATPDPSEVSDEEDPNRPRLDRGKPSASRKTRESNGAPNSKTAASAKPGASPSGLKNSSSAAEGASVLEASVQEIPAISDASGPEPRSYAFPLKPGEADQFRKKLLEQARQLIQAKIKRESSGEQVHHTTRTAAKNKSTVHAPEPTFQNVKLRVFDLSSSNQALMVLEATAQVAGLAEPQQITIVARQDLYGDLHDSLANITDEKHLDVIPRMDLIDVVDADGDGRGELLFRETSDEGRAYSIYRVIGDQLYQLYKSTPQ
jgi:hypothetical protein